MSDLRTKQPVKIVDPTTDAQEAGVDASGNLQVVVNDSLPAGSANIGDVDVVSLPALPAGTNNIGDVDVLSAPYSDAFGAASGEPSEAVLVAGTNGTDTYGVKVDTDGHVQVDVVTGGGGPQDTDDDIVAGGQSAALGIGLNYGWDGTQWERIHSDASGALDVNVTTALPAGTNNIGDVDVLTLPSDTFAAEGQALGKGVLLQGDDGTDRTNVLVDAAGHLQVDVLSGGGVDTPTNPTVDTDSSTATAAGASANLDSSEITEAEKLWQVIVSASVAIKAKVQLFENDVATDITNWLFGTPANPIIWTPPHRDFAAHAGSSAGTDTFRVVCFNQDNSKPADLHASFYYST